MILDYFIMELWGIFTEGFPQKKTAIRPSHGELKIQKYAVEGICIFLKMSSLWVFWYFSVFTGGHGLLFNTEDRAVFILPGSLQIFLSRLMSSQSTI